jgi:hypothetical protein
MDMVAHPLGPKRLAALWTAEFPMTLTNKVEQRRGYCPWRPGMALSPQTVHHSPGMGSAAGGKAIGWG